MSKKSDLNIPLASRANFPDKKIKFFWPHAIAIAKESK